MTQSAASPSSNGSAIVLNSSMSSTQHETLVDLLLSTFPPEYRDSTRLDYSNQRYSLPSERTPETVSRRLVSSYWRVRHARGSMPSGFFLKTPLGSLLTENFPEPLERVLSSSGASEYNRMQRAYIERLKRLCPAPPSGPSASPSPTPSVKLTCSLTASRAGGLRRLVWWLWTTLRRLTRSMTSARSNASLLGSLGASTNLPSGREQRSSFFPRSSGKFLSEAAAGSSPGDGRTLVRLSTRVPWKASDPAPETCSGARPCGSEPNRACFCSDPSPGCAR